MNSNPSPSSPEQASKLGSLSQIRRIDNSRTLLPLATSLLVIFLVIVFIWFFRGGSFRLYASVFFTLYHFTGQIWVSVILMGVLQTVVFLPLRFIGQYAWPAIEDFEEEMERRKNENDQYLIFKKKIREGSFPFIFFIFNFVVNVIAFFSAGRIFLIDFYNYKLNPAYLYDFVPYPDYPLKGTTFFFPFFQIIQSYALKWGTIIKIWLIAVLFFSAIRLLWRPFKIFLGSNKKILSIRINYNRLLLQIGGFSTTLFVLSLFFLRHIPTKLKFIWLAADLTRQNTTMNFITAVATFITTVHAGYIRHTRDARLAANANIPPDIIQKVYRDKMRISFNNALILGMGAFFITNQIPCAFELSVATFEVLYIISPYTFDRLLHINSAKVKSD